jgi:hypothetical protein
MMGQVRFLPLLLYLLVHAGEDGVVGGLRFSAGGILLWTRGQSFLRRADTLLSSASRV